VALHFFKKINPRIYLDVYIHDESVLQLLEREINNVKNNLSLNTTLSELPIIFNCKNDWEKTLMERLKIAPSKPVAVQKMIDDLKDAIQPDYSNVTDEEIKNKNWHKEFRKISYDHYSRGDNVTLKGLGYLLLMENWKRNPKDTFPEEQFLGITSPMPGMNKIILRALAEGATIAAFLPYLEKILVNIHNNIIP